MMVFLNPTKTYAIDLTWSADSVEELESYHFLKSSMFENPEDAISRKDFIYLIVRVCELISGEYIEPKTDQPFRDTNDIYIKKAVTIGLTTGVGGGLFSPDAKITREQMVSYYDKINQLYHIAGDHSTDEIFVDESDISLWARESVYLARANEIITDKNGNYFYPKHEVSRAEALVFTNNIIKSYLANMSGFDSYSNKRLQAILSNKEYYPSVVSEDTYEKNMYIAHGGGEILDLTVSNTYEAIMNSLEKEYLLIEIDFLKTRDHKYVLGHDYSYISKYFDMPYGSFTLERFKNATSKYAITQMDLDDLIYLMETNPNFKVITDTKDDNIELLTYISNVYPDYINRFIPQIFDMDNYDQVKSLGYNHIIYSLYKIYKTDWQVVEFAKSHKLFGVTFAESRANTYIASELNKLGIRSYVHTINEFQRVKILRDLGIFGFYTDNLF